MESPFLARIVGFGAALRGAGLAVGTSELLTFTAAVAELDPNDAGDLYWAGRTTLVGHRDEIAVYHRVFLDHWLAPAAAGADANGESAAAEDGRVTFNLPDFDALPATETLEGAVDGSGAAGTLGSDAEGLHAKPFTACTPAELDDLRRVMRSLRLRRPQRSSRRLRAARRGRLHDLRRTVRETLRTQGEPRRQLWAAPRLRRRPLVLILDVSGSMVASSRALLQFAHSTSQVDRRTEVFCFGTTLTRVTVDLRQRRIDDALTRAAAAVVDFEGGTRIGASLDAFVHDHGRRGVARGGTVVICSDGLDQGRPTELAAALRRLSRQCRRLVWLNPLPSYAPSPGLLLARPLVDAMLPARDLDDLVAFAGALERIDAQPRAARGIRSGAQPVEDLDLRPLRSSPFDGPRTSSRQV
ncbi:vWA domain-containing protein [Nocardioides marmotae]|uniref:VWA domain-containing protein n=1 Tax=Nocardioides marmotae TaxID=2663857 RepID=A0A6I3JAI3_9ACTN|nr:VWA domain-containing protein [Nocardioides marmotae]MCR6030888.1 VWA domain-containing protein [Gordonia jinghuaiqii]MBC9731601.1 VWA domain-containing protein [Nocardioides marmotae]MTB82723.1 VWA domain-containing protein [Nocardioides marmotae]MTB94525.1 VWA domain-containing protein [Nocardioides marmotae]QKE01458.1 VWA domain-containing protein [Nocardioides marmotae]